jgi:hypothetical protein
MRDRIHRDLYVGEYLLEVRPCSRTKPGTFFNQLHQPIAIVVLNGHGKRQRIIFRPITQVGRYWRIPFLCHEAPQNESTTVDIGLLAQLPGVEVLTGTSVHPSPLLRAKEALCAGVLIPIRVVWVSWQSSYGQSKISKPWFWIISIDVAAIQSRS